MIIMLHAKYHLIKYDKYLPILTVLPNQENGKNILQFVICNEFNYNPKTLIRVANIFNINCNFALDKTVACNNDLKTYFYAHFQLN